MTFAAEPFVVILGAGHAPPERLIRMADVLITTSDNRSGPAQSIALFGDLPGLTLILVIGPDRVVEVRFRDGTGGPIPLDRLPPLRRAAVLLYHGWLAQFGADDIGLPEQGADPDQRQADPASLHVRHGAPPAVANDAFRCPRPDAPLG
jgi:hypothetical protein